MKSTRKSLEEDQEDNSSSLQSTTPTGRKSHISIVTELPACQQDTVGTSYPSMCQRTVSTNQHTSQPSCDRFATLLPATPKSTKKIVYASADSVNSKVVKECEVTNENEELLSVGSPLNKNEHSGSEIFKQMVHVPNISAIESSPSIIKINDKGNHSKTTETTRSSFFRTSTPTRLFSQTGNQDILKELTSKRILRSSVIKASTPRKDLKFSNKGNSKTNKNKSVRTSTPKTEHIKAIGNDHNLGDGDTCMLKPNTSVTPQQDVKASYLNRTVKASCTVENGPVLYKNVSVSNSKGTVFAKTNKNSFLIVNEASTVLSDTNRSDDSMRLRKKVQTNLDKTQSCKSTKRQTDQTEDGKGKRNNQDSVSHSPKNNEADR